MVTKFLLTQGNQTMAGFCTQEEPNTLASQPAQAKLGPLLPQTGQPSLDKRGSTSPTMGQDQSSSPPFLDPTQDRRTNDYALGQPTASEPIPTASIEPSLAGSIEPKRNQCAGKLPPSQKILCATMLFLKTPSPLHHLFQKAPQVCVIHYTTTLHVLNFLLLIKNSQQHLSRLQKHSFIIRL